MAWHVAPPPPQAFVEGWLPNRREQSTVQVDDPTRMFDAVGGARSFFEPPLVFDVLPGGGIAYSDSSGYAIRIRRSPSSPDSGSAPEAVVESDVIVS